MLVFVSTSEDGWIDGYRMDRETGTLTPVSRTEVGRLVMPMACGASGHHRLYAAVRSAPFTLNSYAIDPRHGTLALLGKTPPLIDNKVYLSTDQTGRFLLTASFAGNNFAVFGIDDNGCVEPAPRQVVPIGGKAHCILVEGSNRFVYAINFGEGRIHQFRFDAETGVLTENDPAYIQLDRALGPRVAVLSPDTRYLYLIHQRTGDVAQFAIDQRKGTLRHISDTPSVPPHLDLLPASMTENAAEANSQGASTGDVARIWASDIQITPNGRFLYTTERTSNTLSIFSIAPDKGTLQYVAYIETERQPRTIAIDPSGKWLVAAGEKSDRLSVYAIDQLGGQLSLIDRYAVGRGANWITITA